MAATVGNKPMVGILGGSFEGGASMKNDEGSLPLHLAVGWW